MQVTARQLEDRSWLSEGVWRGLGRDPFETQMSFGSDKWRWGK